LYKLILIAITLTSFSCGKQSIKESHRSRQFNSQNATAKATAIDSEKMKKDIVAIVGNSCESESGGAALYGSKSFEVAAKSWWKSSELYLKKGETAKISASGKWTIWADKTTEVSADGYSSFAKFKGCNKGALVAKVGLYETSLVHCVGIEGTFKAEADGIVYLAMNDSSSPSYHGGAINVTVASQGSLAPTLTLSQLASTEFCELGDTWVELHSQDHIILTVPTALAENYRSSIAESLDFFDNTYKYHQQLAGGQQPYDGARLRFFPDYSLTDVSWIVVDNPVRFDPRALNAIKPSETKLLDITNPESNSWDFVQSIGAIFSRMNGSEYQPGALGSQSWGGIFAIYSLNQMNKNDVPPNLCFRRESFQETGTFSTIDSSALLQTCALLHVAQKSGWQLLTEFFKRYAAISEDDKLVLNRDSNLKKWAWFGNRLDEIDPNSLGPSNFQLNLPIENLEMTVSYSPALSNTLTNFKLCDVGCGQ